MSEEQTQEPAGKPPKGYGKRPMWQWVLIYLVAAVIVYGIIYLVFFNNGGGSGGTGGGFTY